MKRQIIICVVLFVLLIFFLVTFRNMINRNEISTSETETEQRNTESATEEVTEILKESIYKYMIVEEEGRLTVYETKNRSVFIETAIKVKFLPYELQDDLLDGIYFESEEDMLDFLESYSS